MKYVFNFFATEDDREIEYHDITYRLDGTSHMGNTDFLVYKSDGSEPLLIAPTFVEQYREAAEKLKRVMHVTNIKAVRIRLNSMFPGTVTENGEDNEEGGSYEYRIRYKDIDLRLLFEHEKLTLAPYFHIYSEKLIDSRRDISLEEVPELQEYFE